MMPFSRNAATKPWMNMIVEAGLFARKGASPTGGYGVRRSFIFGLLLASSVASPALHAAEQEQNVTVNLRQDTVQLFDIIMPLSDVKEVFVGNFVKSFSKSFDSDQRAPDVDRLNPGLRDVLRSAVIREIELQAPREFAVLRDKLALDLQNTLTMDDTKTAIAFFGSPAGIRMRERINNEAQLRIDQRRETGEITRGGTQAVNLAAEVADASALRGMTANDSRAVARFNRTSAARKMDATRDLFMASLSDELDSLSKRILDKINPVIEATVAKHMSSK